MSWDDNQIKDIDKITKYLQIPSFIKFNTQIDKETEFALLCIFNKNNSEVKIWLPKSQIEYSNSNTSKKINILIPDWLVEKNNLWKYSIK